MRSSTEISTKCGFFIFLVMCLVAVLAQLLFAERASAGEEPAVEQPLALYILMHGRHQEIEHYRIEVPEGSTCYEHLKTVEFGPHSRSSKFCTRYLMHTGSLVKFKKLDSVDELY